VSRDLYCVICCRDITASGRSFRQFKPNRAIVEVKGVSVCGEHIDRVVKVTKPVRAPRLP